jgi:hypothetical protein
VTAEEIARWVHLYVQERHTIERIALDAYRSRATVARALKRAGVQMRTPADSQRGSKRPRVSKPKPTSDAAITRVSLNHRHHRHRGSL